MFNWVTHNLISNTGLFLVGGLTLWNTYVIFCNQQRLEWNIGVSFSNQRLNALEDNEDED